MDDFDKLIAEYSEDYCLFLEATYSEGMMSEGGADGVDLMFSGVDVRSKKMLDIGFGLGGVAFYLAEKYAAHVTGLELNPWMVEEAIRRTPAHLKSLVKFVEYDESPLLPFADGQFDIVFSKGVLTHLHDKQPLFKEAIRTLKSGGLFIVNDWLSPHKDQWGARLQKMCEIEDLTLYAETEANYKNLLEQAGFQQITVQDEGQVYAKYNEEVVEHLNSPEYSKAFIEKFGEQSWKEAIECYQLIADSIRDGELLVQTFKCMK